MVVGHSLIKGVTLMVTYSELFTFSSLIVSIINLCVLLLRKK